MSNSGWSGALNARDVSTGADHAAVETQPQDDCVRFDRRHIRGVILTLAVARCEPSPPKTEIFGAAIVDTGDKA